MITTPSFSDSKIRVMKQDGGNCDHFIHCLSQTTGLRTTSTNTTNIRFIYCCPPIGRLSTGIIDVY